MPNDGRSDQRPESLLVDGSTNLPDGRHAGRVTLAWMKLVLATMLVVAAGCDGECIDGVCPDLSVTVAGPGPCESAYAGGGYSDHCTYSYEGDRITLYECTWHTDEHGTDKTTYSYDANGQFVQIDAAHVDISDTVGSHYERWDFTADEVKFSRGGPTSRTYDRATFAFLPTPGSYIGMPQAELGLKSGLGVTYRWTSTGTTRTRTSSAGEIGTLELDERGRVIETRFGETITYTYDEDHLLSIQGTSASGSSFSNSFDYDAAGNVATRQSSFGREVYDNTCW